MKFKTQTNFKHWIFIVLSMFLCNLSALAVQLQIGQTTYFSVTAPEGYITSASWSASAPQLQLEPQMEVCTVCFWNYYEGNVTVTCNFTYTYQSYYNGRYHNKIGNGSRSFIVTCVRPSFSLDKTKVTLQPGEKMILSSITSPKASSQYPKVYWQNSNSSVVEIKYDEVYDNSYTQKVTILAKESGTSTITASIGGGISATCEITVANIDPSSVSLPSTASTKVGESLKLTPTLYPSDAETTYSWSSDNTGVATVSQNGLVSGKKTGMANITVRTANGKSATCRVTVEKGDLTLSCNTESGLIVKGTKVSLTANRSDAEIYYTFDGSTPTSNSNRYTGSITINEALTLKAIATGSEYNTSSVMTREYQVTSLVLLSINPEDGTYNAKTIPSVTFNDYVYESDHFKDIKLKDASNSDVPGDAVIIDGILHYVPWSNTLSIGKYILIIPESSMVGKNGDKNAYMECQFEILKSASEPRMLDVATHWGLFLSVGEDGSLWTWGNNRHGGLGLGINASSRNYPSKIMDNVKAISTNYARSMAVQEDGTLWVWGNNDDGYLGDGTKNDHNTPFKLSEGVESVAQSENQSFYIKKDGTLWGYGSNHDGVLGIGTENSQTTPVNIMSNVRQVSSGRVHTMIIKKDDSLWGCGDNLTGRLGIGKEKDLYNWVHLNFEKVMDGVKQVSAGLVHSLILKKNGTLWFCGLKGPGQLEDGSWGPEEKVYIPQKCMDDVVSISAASSQSFAIKKDGTLWAWGNNDYGQLGDGTTYPKYNPTKVMENVEKIYAADYNTMAIKKDGSVWIWGEGYGIRPQALPNGFFQTNTVESIKLKNETIVLSLGSKSLIRVECLPMGSEYKVISFDGYDEKRISVSSRGVITPLQTGTTDVTVTVDDLFTATCKVTVEESTGINEVESKRTADGHIYSLSGQRLAAPKKGINIINGRKVIVK